jgi:hypothetical protein
MAHPFDATTTARRDAHEGIATATYGGGELRRFDLSRTRAFTAVTDISLRLLDSDTARPREWLWVAWSCCERQATDAAIEIFET